MSAPADAREAKWEFLSGAPEDASQRQLFAKLWPSVTAKNVHGADARLEEAP